MIKAQLCPSLRRAIFPHCFLCVTHPSQEENGNTYIAKASPPVLTILGEISIFIHYMKSKIRFSVICAIAAVIVLLAMCWFVRRSDDFVQRKPVLLKDTPIATVQKEETERSNPAEDKSSRPDSVPSTIPAIESTGDMPIVPSTHIKQSNTQVISSDDDMPGSMTSDTNINIMQTRSMVAAHSPLRESSVSDPDSEENIRILQEMMFKALSNPAEAEQKKIYAEEKPVHE